MHILLWGFKPMDDIPVSSRLALREVENVDA